MWTNDSTSHSSNNTEFLRARLLLWNSNNKIQVQVYGTGQIIDNVNIFNPAGIISKASIGSDVFLYFPYGDHSIPHALLKGFPSRIPYPASNGELVLYDQETGNPKISIVNDQITLYGDVQIDRQDGTGPRRIALQDDLDTAGDMLI